MTIEPLPPILLTPGLRLIEMGTNRQGTYLKFGVDNNDVREITIYMISPGPTTWKYVYSMWDEATRTVITYRGKHGDPTKDRRVGIRGA